MTCFIPKDQHNKKKTNKQTKNDNNNKKTQVVLSALSPLTL